MPWKLQNHRFHGVSVGGSRRELDLQQVLRKLRAAYRQSREIAGQRDAVFRSARPGNLQIKSVMRSIPVLRDEPEV